MGVSDAGDRPDDRGRRHVHARGRRPRSWPRSAVSGTSPSATSSAATSATSWRHRRIQPGDARRLNVAPSPAQLRHAGHAGRGRGVPADLLHGLHHRALGGAGSSWAATRPTPPI
ncbi:MAG: hypothetical protein MZV70_41080 [Desulfobacterales bacterium]|nr:hypothetical protein [Desulfobacterales bacterium]